MWACLVEGFNTLATAGALNLPDKRVNSRLLAEVWVRIPTEATCCKPLLGSYQLWTLHWSDIVCALLGLRANKLYPFSI